jgi:ribonuclease G
VSKEPINEKGAKLTTCFTIPGRFLVLMPNISKIGISKKIDSKEERQRLKDIISEHLPEGMGAIIRTTSEFRSSQEILRDLNYLIDIWNNIQKKYNEVNPKEQVYEDIELSLQIIRDHLDNDVDSVIIDNKDLHNYIYRFVKNVSPDYI